MAEECLKRAMDLSGLLLLYSSLGDAKGITQLASLAKDPNYKFELAIQLGRLEIAKVSPICLCHGIWVSLRAFFYLSM